MSRKNEKLLDKQHAGMSTREYSIRVKLPAYISKVHEAVTRAGTLPNVYAENTEKIRQTLHLLGWILHVRTRRARQFAYAARRRGKRIEEVYLAPLDDIATLQERAALLPNK